MKKWVQKKLGVAELENRCEELRKRCSDLESEGYALDNRLRAIESLVNAGMDITPIRYKGYDRSWAVICIAGKPERVRFIDLTDMEAQELQEFVRRFDWVRNPPVIDAPPFLAKELRRGR